MAKGPATVSEHNAERTMQAASYGMDWMRQFMEQSLNQTAAMFESFLTNARRTADSFDQQASEARERSMSARNGNALQHNELRTQVHARERAAGSTQLQSEFVSQQAQALAEQSKLLGQSIARGAIEVGKLTSRGFAEVSRRGSEAA